MELPPKLIEAERWLAAALIALTAAVCLLEMRSPLAAAIRENRPWICRIKLLPSRGDEFLAVYQTSLKTVTLIWLDEEPWPDAPLMTLPAPAGRFEEPPVAAKEAAASRTLKAWIAAIKGIRGFDHLLFLLELSRLPSFQIRPAYLPQDSSERKSFLDGLFAEQSSPSVASRMPLTVEVLNASSRKGIASDVTKFLRSKGADVVHYGNLPAERSNTIIYDRTGRYENALWVRERLGCAGQAPAVTQINAKSLVDVTVVLADDCRL